MSVGQMTPEYMTRMATLIDEMRSESDRSVAIVGAAWVEEALLAALLSCLDSHEKAKKRLFSVNGALGTFAARVDLARMVGMITDPIWRDLDKIREVRNIFAHRVAHEREHTQLTFNSDILKGKVLSMECVAYEQHSNPRTAYIRACAILNSDFELATMVGDKAVVTGRIFARGIDCQ